MVLYVVKSRAQSSLRFVFCCSLFLLVLLRDQRSLLLFTACEVATTVLHPSGAFPVGLNACRPSVCPCVFAFRCWKWRLPARGRCCSVPCRTLPRPSLHGGFFLLCCLGYCGSWLGGVGQKRGFCSRSVARACPWQVGGGVGRGAAAGWAVACWLGA